MSDHSELKKAALRVVEIESSEGESISDAWEDFESAANPAAVLTLISEVEGLRAQHCRDSAELRSLSQARDDARKERDQLKTEVDRLTADNASLRGSCAKLGVEHAGMVRIHRKANTEIRRLHAEVEALRKDAERYRWLMSDAVNNGTLGIDGGWIDFGFKDEAAEIIEAAMTKGEQP